MPYYAHVDRNTNKVYTISHSPNQIIEISEMDERISGTHYFNGQFVGYKIILTSDKVDIKADGTDEATITATIYTWDDQVAADYTNPIIFEANGYQTEAQIPTDGVAMLPLTSAEPGTYTVKVIVDDPYLISSTTVEVVASE